jgi:hypothetical protein
MENRDLFVTIESPQFAAEMNVASGYKQFSRALITTPQVRTLLAQSQSLADLTELLTRMETILLQPIERGYESAYDVALAAYLWVLRKTVPDLAFAIAQPLQDAPGFWWARKMAAEILSARRESVVPQRIVHQISAPAPVEVKAAESAYSRSGYFVVHVAPDWKVGAKSCPTWPAGAGFEPLFHVKDSGHWNQAANQVRQTYEVA